MLLNQDLTTFLEELYQTASEIVKLENEVEIIKEAFDHLYLENGDYDEFMNLRAKLARIRLMLATEEDV